MVIWTKPKEEVIEEPDEIIYPEIPVAYTKFNQIACLPLSKSGDMPTIGIAGKKGSGKSSTMHSLQDNIRNKTNDKMLIVNDVNEETIPNADTWERSNGTHDKFIRRLDALNLKSIRCPVVHVNPLPKNIRPNLCEINMSLKPEEVLSSQDFLGIKKIASKDYILKVLELIDEDKRNNFDEIVSVIRNSSMPRGVKAKLINVYENVFRSGLIDNKHPHSLLYKGKEYPLIHALMLANLVPAIITSKIRNDITYFHAYMKKILTDLFNVRMSDNNYFGDSKIWIFFDEMYGLMGKGNNPSSQIIRNIFAEGRPKGIGSIWSNVVYNNIPEDIRTSTTHMIMFKYKNEKQVGDLAKDFDLRESEKKQIINLDKKRFECLLCAQDYWVTYDLKTGERNEVDKAILGYAIPPLSQHKPPNYKVPEKDLRYASVYLKAHKKRLINPRTEADIFNGYDEQIKIHYKQYPNNSFIPGKNVLRVFSGKRSEQQNRVQIDYNELQEYGYYIISVPVLIPRFKGQKVFYRLVPKNIRLSSRINILPSCPENTIILFDVQERRVAIQGPNIKKGLSDWRPILK